MLVSIYLSREFMKYNENYMIKWLEGAENFSAQKYKEGQTNYIDDNLITSWSPKKSPIVKKYAQSKRFQYFLKLKKESGGCNLCGSKKELVIDHCHTSRKIRGVLCHNCNHGLGKFKDDVNLLKKAIEYLTLQRKDAVDYYTLK